jgi:hypothetical protein
MLKNRLAGFALATCVIGVAHAHAQSILVDLLQRHGVQVRDGGIDAAFDAHVSPTVPVNAGSFATPLAVLTTSTGVERIAGAYAFGILAGRSGRSASPQENAAAGQALVSMIGSADRRSRIVGARVAGRLFAAPFDQSGVRAAVPTGLVEALFVILNQDNEIEQLAAMDALGLLREASAVAALTERYYFHRQANKRALAGGALEALARIGHPSTLAVVQSLGGDRWAEGKDATALAVVYARERFLKDGSINLIQQALDDRSRRNQARGYLAELGAPVP